MSGSSIKLITLDTLRWEASGERNKTFLEPPEKSGENMHRKFFYELLLAGATPIRNIASTWTRVT